MNSFSTPACIPRHAPFPCPRGDTQCFFHKEKKRRGGFEESGESRIYVEVLGLWGGYDYSRLLQIIGLFCRIPSLL